MAKPLVLSSAAARDDANAMSVGQMCELAGIANLDFGIRPPILGFQLLIAFIMTLKVVMLSEHASLRTRLNLFSAISMQ